MKIGSENELHGFEKLRLTSSGSKIMNQVMMFLIVGILPWLFPDRIKIENRSIVFIIVFLALTTSVFYELYRIHLEKRKKNIHLLLTIQLLTSVFLLTPFLFFFGRINGPFFILYLLTIMESFLNLNIVLSYVIVLIMMTALSLEYLWLGLSGEGSFGFVSLVGYAIRVLSILFMSTYGYVLAEKTISEEKAKNRVQEYAGDLEAVKKELEDTNVKLQELDAQKNEFISMAAHELRAPMTAIKGYISMILEGDTGDIPEKARGYLADCTAINDRSVRLVNNMLNVSRIEEGRMAFQYEVDQLSRNIRTVFSQFMPEAKRKGLEYSLDIPNHIKDRVNIDTDKINEISGNLVSNAIKYTEKGFVKIKLRQPSPGIVRFEVEDSGSGITEVEQAKLFQKFYRVESNVGKTTGTGLGLYISKLMVEKMGGKIGIISEFGKGSTFWYELPVVD